MKFLLRLIMLVAAIALAVTALAYRYTNQAMNKPLAISEPFNLVVKKGDTARKLGTALEARGAIENGRMFSLYARFNQFAPNIKAGEYNITPKDTPHTLLERIVKGSVVQRGVTLVEGNTTKNFVATLNQRLPQGKTHPIKLADLMASVGSKQHPEGQFFPDTYYFTQEATPLDILTRAYAVMQKILAEEWANRAEGLPYKTPYEALIMASIVEKETGDPSERAQIAGVFVRRLQKGMRLQTDPTVIYGIGDAYTGNITRKHLRTPTPYNTYTQDGLPPTPIANPGREAIHAALHPEAGTSLYFVAKGDGSHQFSDTLQQHQRAVRQYQLQRRANYRSAPKPQ